jgi:aerobic-type carbon monoxide dehydrogenase small subunit (CoxS/CutS family)
LKEASVGNRIRGLIYERKTAMKKPITLNVNGETFDLLIEPRRTLAEVLREDLHLMGTKIGCGTGDCGACTVLMDGTAVFACLTLAIEVQDNYITTIEGLAEGDKLDVLQRAFVDHGAIQCGFCTPGMILAAKGLLRENANPTRHEITEAIGGNLCRCTGYVKIIDAIESVAQAKDPSK